MVDELEQLDNQEFNLDKEAAEAFVLQEQEATEKLRAEINSEKVYFLYSELGFPTLRPQNWFRKTFKVSSQ